MTVVEALPASPTGAPLAVPAVASATGEAALRNGPWRALPRTPQAPAHAAICRSLFLRVAHGLPVRVSLPGGRTIGSTDPADPRLDIHRDDFFHRVGHDGLIGFGESYMAGDWDADDLGAALRPFAERVESLVPAWMQRLRHLYVRHQPPDEANTKRGARRNIERHYDLSNDLFSLFLDESMTYSCAWFEPGDTLERAQERKIDRLLDAVRVDQGTRLVEIGTGWGALAIRAARRGARVTTLTLSREQQDVARRRVSEAGVADRVDVQLRDYRDATGRYDAAVSVEMLEAVGERYWPKFFSTVDGLVERGGRLGVQTIVFEHARMVATRGQYTWISKYIFPGGAIPSVRAIESAVAEHTRLVMRDRFHFGRHYATTLHEWRARFDARTADLEALGFDPVFHRMWDFYLAYCEAGFSTGYLDDVQLVLDAAWSDFASGEFASGLLVTAATVVALLAVTFVVGRAIGRYNVIDVAWGLGFVLVAVVSYARSSGDGDPALRAVMLAVVAVWGLRLTAYLGWRSRGKGEDRRYALMFERATGSVPAYAFVHVFLPQGIAMWFISFPVQVAMYQCAPGTVLPAVGLVLWLVGLGFESIGDRQLSRFLGDPANRGHVMDRGLWRFTRHPNYFGDACVWWGIFLVACGQWQGLLTIGSPILMTWTLVGKTGRPMLEHEMVVRRPGYAAYVRRTSGFVPRPPRPRD